MTWEELCEKARKFGYCLHEDDLFDGLDGYGKVRYLEKRNGGVSFYEEGGIETNFELFAENRTYEQMYAIMKALED